MWNMAAYDFSKTFAITVTNAVTQVEYDSPGMRTGPYAVAAGTTAYLNRGVQIPMFETNVVKVLEYGDTLVVKPGSSEEAAHYLMLDIPGITVTQAQS